MGFKKIIFALEFIGITSAYVASYTLPLLGNFSVYGTVLLAYFLIQSVTSVLNDRNMMQLPTHPQEHPSVADAEAVEAVEEGMTTLPIEDPPTNKKVVLVVVGHRENPDYWKKCILSVCGLDTSNLLKVYFFIDGNEEEDLYMYDMAHTLLAAHTPDDFSPVDVFRAEKRGKRGVMYSGIERVRHEFHEKEGEILVAVSDSDTVLRKNALIELEKCICSHPKNGCATGFLEIYNMEDGFLPKLINARYHYAFGLERSCQSYFGCMTCCSGPLSIYKLEALKETVMQRFITQSLAGVRCEPGDDRHLTNLVMSQGYFSRQTSFAVASTEAPETMMRFLLQQLRWSRSYYREIKWQMECLDHQSYFLGFTTVYEGLFPWFILVWIVLLLYRPHAWKVYMGALFLSLGIMVVRTLLLFLRFRQCTIFYNLLYYPMYFLFLLPTKLFAALTLLNNTWVTQSRDSKVLKCSPDALYYFAFVGIWQVFLLLGVGLTVTGLVGLN